MTDWHPLRAALARARAADLSVPIWWRDDDAIVPTPELDQLSELSERTRVPVHLAVISAHADRALASYLAGRPHLKALVHGWTHENQAEAGLKKSEFPTCDQATIKRAQSGIDRLRNLIGPDLLPVFVPPWNRMDLKLVNDLKRMGYFGLSTFGPRSTSLSLPQINTHIDPIFWRGHRGLVDPDLLIAQTVARMSARLEGREDGSEPLGYLTHHLVHTPEIWDFSERFLGTLLEGGAVIADLRKDLV